MQRAILAFIAGWLVVTTAAAADFPFKQINPDTDKYNFAKSFIMGLSYYGHVAERLASEEKAALQGKPAARVVHEFVDHRTLDNTDLRIAKNYLSKYFGSKNGLIRQVARQSTAIYEKLLVMSVRERELWQVFDRYKTTGFPRDFDEEDFSRRQVLLAREKKEISKDFVHQALMVTKVLLSAERCETDACQELVLSQVERDKLVKRIDEFASDNMDWGMKPGQSTFQACVATLREVLEDPIYHSRL